MPIVSNNAASSTSAQLGKLKITSQLFLRPAGDSPGYGGQHWGHFTGGTTGSQRWF